MTRERYESLPLATLRELAKARKMKGVSTLKKGELIDAMLALDEQEEQAEAASEAKEEVKEEMKEKKAETEDLSGATIISPGKMTSTYRLRRSADSD